MMGYKLKHSRLLTCYSALLYLLAIYRRNETVGPADAVSMISLSPVERLEWLMKQPDLQKASGLLDKLLQKYERFLEATNSDSGSLVKRFLDSNSSRSYLNDAHEFGDLVFDALTLVGNGNRFHRLLVV